MGALGSCFSEVATSPRKAFSLAMRGGEKVVWAWWWYCIAIGVEVASMEPMIVVVLRRWCVWLVISSAVAKLGWC